MTVAELISELQKIEDKTKDVYMRIGGLPLINVDDFELDVFGDVILIESNET